MKIKSFENFINEVNTPETRCTNVTLRTFGICSDELIMRGVDVDLTINKAFSKDEIFSYQPIPAFMVLDTLEPIDVDRSKIDGDRAVLSPKFLGENQGYHVYPKFNGFFYRKTISRFIRTILNLDGYGHYVIHVNGHLLGIHYLKNGELWMIDNEEKFESRRQINQLIVIDRKNLDQVFQSYLEEMGDFRKLKRIK